MAGLLGYDRDGGTVLLLSLEGMTADQQTRLIGSVKEKIKAAQVWD